ncbi:MAG: hypothetical protein RR382_00035 [Tannerellaceae bacterium]
MPDLIIPRAMFDLLRRTKLAWSKNKLLDHSAYIATAETDEYNGYVPCGTFRVTDGKNTGNIAIFRSLDAKSATPYVAFTESGFAGVLDVLQQFSIQSAILAITGMTVKEIALATECSECAIKSWIKPPGKLIPLGVLKTLLDAFLNDEECVGFIPKRRERSDTSRKPARPGKGRNK